jgi:hypothetical protein
VDSEDHPYNRDNFVFALMSYLEERLGHYSSYCVCCHTPHSCYNPDGGVVCRCVKLKKKGHFVLNFVLFLQRGSLCLSIGGKSDGKDDERALVSLQRMRGSGSQHSRERFSCCFSFEKLF